MPTWEFSCPKCKQVEARFLLKGPPPKTVRCKCGGRAKQIVSLATPRIWKPLTLEHANIDGEGPITFYSEKELKQHCRKHGISSGALL